jgi:hypothetical protein
MVMGVDSETRARTHHGDGIGGNSVDDVPDDDHKMQRANEARSNFTNAENEKSIE